MRLLVLETNSGSSPSSGASSAMGGGRGGGGGALPLPNFALLLRRKGIFQPAQEVRVDSPLSTHPIERT
eukprot:scaffold3906_cov120-Isochrysis_galbana.AAC.6